MTSPETREQVVQRVGAAIARRREDSVADGLPRPVLAEGTAPVVAATLAATTLAEGSAPVALVDQTAPAVATNSPRRRLWPWAAGTAVVALVGTFGYQMYSARAEREQLEARYPIVATAADRVVLEREADRWRAGRDRLLANLAAFDAPSVDSMSGVGDCALAKAAAGSTEVDDAGSIDTDAAISTRMILLPGEQLDGLDVVARPELDAMLGAAKRGRFRTAEARDHVLEALGGGYIVARLHTFSSGVAAGTAYAFDPATGALRCAGTFRTVGDPTVLHELSAQTERAILGSLRAVSL